MMNIVVIFTILILCPIPSENAKAKKETARVQKAVIASGNIIKVMNIFKSSDLTNTFTKFAGMAAKIGPFLGCIGPAMGIVGMFLPGGESAELRFMKEKFADVDAQFDQMFHKFDDLKNAVKESSMRSQYGKHEMAILTLSELLRDTINANVKDGSLDRLKYRKEKFFNYYAKSYDHATELLHNGVMEKGVFSINIPNTFMESSNYDRRMVQDIMKRFFSLILQGAKAEIAYFALNKTGSGEYEHSAKTVWDRRIQALLTHMSEVDLHVKGRWGTAFKKDVDVMVAESKNMNDEDFIVKLYGFLTKKYDWREWYVFVYTTKIKKDEEHMNVLCNGYISDKHGRNVVIGSLDSEEKIKGDIRKVRNDLSQLETKKKAHEFLKKEKFRNELKKSCGYGAIKKKKKPVYRGADDRLVTTESKDFLLYAFV